MAARLYAATAGLPGVEVDEPQVNSLFPSLPPDVIEPLRDWCFFWDWDRQRNQVRWMTAWDTTPEDVDAFAHGVTSATEAIASKN
jgi:threonine aldolase